MWHQSNAYVVKNVVYVTISKKKKKMATIPKFSNDADKEYYLSEEAQKKKVIKHDYLLTVRVCTFADVNSMLDLMPEDVFATELPENVHK
jgi:hypothetical protein